MNDESSHPTKPTPEVLTTSNACPSPPAIGEDRWLWEDPLADDARVKSGAVLLDDVIKEYVLKYNLLIDREHFDEGKLKGGGYTMTPADLDAWRFEPGSNGKDCKVALETGQDRTGFYYTVPRNSLVFIRLKQKLRLPFYMIGRHNLKIRYVYRGLLLGTGPQVDPGFEGNLFIPLHNFTTADVPVYAHESFVSIDFVRTTRFLDDPSFHGKSVDDLRKHLAGKRVLIEEVKVKSRDTLEDYLQGATPRSQMAQFQFDFKKLERKMRWGLGLMKAVAFIEFLLVAGIVFAGMQFFEGYVADLKQESKELKSVTISSSDTQTRLKALEVQVEQLKSRLTNGATLTRP